MVFPLLWDHYVNMCGPMLWDTVMTTTMKMTIVHVPPPLASTTPGLNPPAFVGDDYYCESGNVGVYESANYYLSDPLWEGSGCTSGNGCCAQIGMPWFYRKLPLSVAEDFEIRICKSETHASEDIAVEKFELYVL